MMECDFGKLVFDVWRCCARSDWAICIQVFMEVELRRANIGGRFSAFLFASARRHWTFILTGAIVS